MLRKALSTGLIAALAVLAATLFVTVTPANAQDIVLHNFNDNGKDGANPNAGLIVDAAGNLYGTTETGGAYYGGTAFELMPKARGGWTEKLLYNFPRGSIPLASLVFDAAGNLYGTTWGSTSGPGTVFELTPSAGGNWTAALLHVFGSGKDGQEPAGGLIFDAAGNLYGTTTAGGTHSSGTVFELTPKAGGGWAEKVLYSFAGNGIDGSMPFSSLVLDPSGNLYGSTPDGGLYSQGTVFELTPNPSGVWTEKVLHNFIYDGVDGNNPYANLIFDAAGNLYGTTVDGGLNGLGTAFELTPSSGGIWTEKILHNFARDGCFPYGALAFDTAGNLYGTTTTDGAYGTGTVFELTPEAGGLWAEKVLHSFNNPNGGREFFSVSSVILDSAGNLYGTTFYGGVYGYGTAFEVTH